MPPSRRYSGEAEATMLSPKFTGIEYNSMARMDLRNVKPVANGGKLDLSLYRRTI